MKFTKASARKIEKFIRRKMTQEEFESGKVTENLRDKYDFKRIFSAEVSDNKTMILSVEHICTECSEDNNFTRTVTAKNSKELEFQLKYNVL